MRRYQIIFLIVLVISLLTLPSKNLAASNEDAWRLIKEGGRLLKLSDFWEAEVRFNEAMGIFKANNLKMGIAAAKENMGTLYYELGKYTRALECYEMALEIQEQLGHKKKTGNILAKIALTYDDWGDYAGALRYYKKALVINEQTGIEKGDGSIF